MVYAPGGDNVKVTIDGVNGKGRPTHSEWVGKFDGKPYPVTGAVAGTAHSYKVIKDWTGSSPS